MICYASSVNGLTQSFSIVATVENGSFGASTRTESAVRTERQQARRIQHCYIMSHSKVWSHSSAACVHACQPAKRAYPTHVGHILKRQARCGASKWQSSQRHFHGAACASSTVAGQSNVQTCLDALLHQSDCSRFAGQHLPLSDLVQDDRVLLVKFQSQPARKSTTCAQNGVIFRLPHRSQSIARHTRLQLSCLNFEQAHTLMHARKVSKVTSNLMKARVVKLL